MAFTATTSDAYKLLHDGQQALSQIEANGIRIDEQYLNTTRDELGKKIKFIEQELCSDVIYRKWRRRFGNKSVLGNRQQLATILFKEMGYEPKKGEGTKHGYKTNEAAFDHIDLPFVKNYIKREKYKKMHSTYLTGVLREIVNGYVHPVFNLHFVISYRSSCDTPNFQNIPNRVEEMRTIIRKGFISRFGKNGRIVEFDFKGIEVGVGACYHFDPTMIRYVKDSSRDMHRDTAMELFFLTEAQGKEKLIRHIAKNMFVFPQFYGDYYIQCAKSMWEELERQRPKVTGTETYILDHLKKRGITNLGKCDPDEKPKKGSFEHHVKTIENKFWDNRFPVFAKWRDDIWQQYQRKGYLDYYTGFRVSGVMRRNQVTNLQTQGSAFHCDLWCLIQLQKWMVRRNMKSVIIGQVHDSIIADIHESELERIVTKAHKLMTEDLPAHWPWIIVPMSVEIEASPRGMSWNDKKPLVL